MFPVALNTLTKSPIVINKECRKNNRTSHNGSQKYLTS